MKFVFFAFENGENKLSDETERADGGSAPPECLG